MIAAVVLAAGEGRRFGGGKQLAPLNGRPLLEHALEASEDAGLETRFVVLGAGADRILASVDLHGHEAVLCPDWNEGMAASLRAGVKAARAAGASAILITLGDQPRVTTAAIRRVLAAREDAFKAVRASYAGKPGHPTLLEESLFDTLLALRGDEGARGVFDSAFTKIVSCDDVADPTDVDVAADLEALTEQASSTPPHPPATPDGPPAP